jgi:hypothetical protein
VLTSRAGEGPGYRVVSVLTTGDRGCWWTWASCPRRRPSPPRRPRGVTVTATSTGPTRPIPSRRPDLGATSGSPATSAAWPRTWARSPSWWWRGGLSPSTVHAPSVDSASVRNDHWEYAVTWFSLAAVWARMSAASCATQREGRGVRRPIALVDAFADRPFAGNPAAVMILDAPLPETVMQDVAAEMARPRPPSPCPGTGGLGPAVVLAHSGGGLLRPRHPRHRPTSSTRRAAGATSWPSTPGRGVLRVGVEGERRYGLDLPRRDPRPQACPPAHPRRRSPSARATTLRRARRGGGGPRLCSDFRAIAEVMGSTGWASPRPARTPTCASRYLLARGRHPRGRRHGFDPRDPDPLLGRAARPRPAHRRSGLAPGRAAGRAT